MQYRSKARRGEATTTLLECGARAFCLYPLTSHALVVEDTENNSSHLGRPSGLSSLSGICDPIIPYHLGSWTLAYAKGRSLEVEEEVGIWIFGEETTSRAYTNPPLSRGFPLMGDAAVSKNDVLRAYVVLLWVFFTLLFPKL